MKNMFRKFFVIALTVLLLPIQTVNANTTQNSPTMGEIEKELLSYLESKNINYELGSTEYVDYLLSILLYDEDKDLMNHADYENIRLYASEYLNEIDGKSIDEVEGEDVIEHIENKTLDEIKDEIKNEEIDIENEINEFKENNENLVSPLASYSGSSAASYAKKWYNKRNGLYNSYIKDCTNFVSQAVLAGGKSEKKPSSIPTGVKSTTSYWYSDRYEEWRTNYYVYRWKESTSWIRVSDFYSYWAKTQKVVTSSNVNTIISNAKVGDVIQFKNKSGSWYHSMIVVAKPNGTLTLAGHSDNTATRNIKDITSSNSFRVIKFS